MNKVVLLFSNYGPYHFSRLTAFQSLCKELNWEVTGIELSRIEKAYPWQFEVDKYNGNFISVISDRPFEEASRFILTTKLIFILSKLNPDILAIAGYSDPSILFSLFWANFFCKRVILLSASKEDDCQRSRIRELFKSWIVNRYQAALVGGEAQKKYLMKLGMSSEQIFTGYNVVGNDNFHPNNIKSLASPMQKPYFLAINRFVKKKNIPNLISAYAAYRQVIGLNAWDLVVLGDGKLRPQIEQQITDLNLQDSIHLPGFLQQQEQLPYFAHAGCFVHASAQEQWGLVVNEAMAAGLPVIVSNSCGCFEELVIEGVNGFGFAPYDTEKLTKLMVKVSSEEVNLIKMGQSSLAHIQNFSPEYFAGSLARAINYSMNNFYLRSRTIK